MKVKRQPSTQHKGMEQIVVINSEGDEWILEDNIEWSNYWDKRFSDAILFFRY